MTEFRPRSDTAAPVGLVRWPHEELRSTDEPPVTRDEYLALRARTTCLEHIVAAFAASLRNSVDRAVLTDLLEEGSRRYANQRPHGFAPSLSADERDGQWARVCEEFAELRALISDLSWNEDSQPSAAQGATQQRGFFVRLKTFAVQVCRYLLGAQPKGTSKRPHDHPLAHLGAPLREYYKHVVDEPLPESLVAIVERFNTTANARG
jgi:hypothetical protein